MASRAAVRARRSPHRSRVRAAAAAPARAALLHSHSCLLPLRSCSPSPMPPFLLLLLILLLLLEDVGAQQGEWSRSEESLRGARSAGHERNLQMRGGDAGRLGRAGGPGSALATWSSSKGGISLLARLYFFGKTVHFPEKREVRPCYQVFLFAIGFFWGKSLVGKREVLET